MNLAGKSLPANPLCDLLETKYSRVWDVRAKTPLPACPSRGRHHPRLFTSCCQDAKGGLISHPKPGMRAALPGPAPSAQPRAAPGGGGPGGQADSTWEPRTEGPRGKEWRCPQHNSTPLPACSRFTPEFTGTWTELRRAHSQQLSLQSPSLGLKEPVRALSYSLPAPSGPDGQRHHQRCRTARRASPRVEMRSGDKWEDDNHSCPSAGLGLPLGGKGPRGWRRVLGAVGRGRILPHHL